VSREDDKLDYEEDEDDDLDALIEEFESQNSENAGYYEDEEADSSGGCIIPEELLQTDTQIGFNSIEVLARRKKYNYNLIEGQYTSKPL
jgi:hypothetical protein